MWCVWCALVADIYSPNFDLLLWKSITTKEFDRSESRWVSELSWHRRYLRRGRTPCWRGSASAARERCQSFYFFHRSKARAWDLFCDTNGAPCCGALCCGRLRPRIDKKIHPYDCAVIHACNLPYHICELRDAEKYYPPRYEAPTPQVFLLPFQLGSHGGFDHPFFFGN